MQFDTEVRATNIFIKERSIGQTDEGYRLIAMSITAVAMAIIKAAQILANAGTGR